MILILNWSWNIFDDDDPYTLAYHFFGRNRTVQTPYSAYDSMCDYLLSFLPRNYKVLLGTMITATFLCGVGIFVLIGKMASNFLGERVYRIYFFTFLILIAVPAFDYLLLSFKSSIIGFFFVLLSHYILIKNNDKENSASIGMLFLSAIVFGFGVCCRWNLIIYGLPIFADTAYLYYQKSKSRGLFKPLIWGGLAIISFVLFINISGYNVNKFLEVVLWGKEYIEHNDFQLMSILGAGIDMLTPAFIILIIIGMAITIARYKDNWRIIIYFLCSLLPMMYLGLYPNLKFLITLFPALCIILIVGCQYIYNDLAARTKLVKPLFWVLLLLPWFIGFQVFSNTTLWGPGFDIKTNALGMVNADKKLDNRLKISNIKPRLGAGFAITAPEGARPLWGNFYVLFCGKLDKLDKKLFDEADTVVATSAKEHMYIYTDRPNPMLLASLCRLNYQTTDSMQPAGDFIVRNFTNAKDTVVWELFKHKRDISNFSMIKKLIPTHRFVGFFTYSSLMAKFIKDAPDKGINIVRQTGPFSCIFEIASR
ncbi:MAG: hypothetical protein H0X33_02300 [Taibaiella sp.]|nr:hypothetical protein [Taibaiella sp.]